MFDFVDAERDFSKLKIIKTPLRNLMNQETLNELLIISIDGMPPNEMNLSQCVMKFATEKNRRMQTS